MNEFLEKIKPLMKTRAMFGVFCLGDGSCYFCSACGRRTDGPQGKIEHKDDCGFIAHGRAIDALKLALMDAGIE